MYGYLCVQGGFVLPQALNSCSTDLRAQIGALRGVVCRRAINYKRQMIIFCVAKLVLRRFRFEMLFVLCHLLNIRRLNENPNIIGGEMNGRCSNSDRMGYRFQGQTLELKQPLEMLSHAIQFGSVQVPPSGQPIILMADAQTTGGYPKIANVIDADLGALAQVRLGSTIKFEAVSLQEAAKLRRKMKYTLIKLGELLMKKIDLNADIAEGFPLMKVYCSCFLLQMLPVAYTLGCKGNAKCGQICERK